MQKKLIALALASAFAAPAFAATSNVDIGGTMDISFDYLNADKTPNPAKGITKDNGNLNVSSNASNIFFKGSEDLGGGLKAIWQIQSYFTVGGTGNGDTGVLGEAPKDGISSGNTYVGLAGGFGTVLMGKHEAPAKIISRSVDLFNNQIGDTRNFTANSGKSLSVAAAAMTASGTATVLASGVYSAGFDLRPNNVIAYATPNFSGFTAMAAYVTNAGDAGATTDHSVDAWSANAKYENGPIYLGLGWQKHNLSKFDSALYDEQTLRLAGGFTMADLKLVGYYEKQTKLNSYNSVADTLTSAHRNIWGLGAAYKLGAVTLKGQYYKSGKLSSVADSGATMYALGADYSLSKRTTVLAAYAKTNNDSGASYSAFGGGHGDNPGTSLGGDPSGFSIGVRHAF